MSKTYLLLQKKLHELESEFAHLSKYLPEISGLNPIAKKFRHRLVFLRNLLTAEIALHSLKPNHLVQIEGRLVEIEAAFHHRYTHMNSFDGVHGDNDLVCSCSESNLNHCGDQTEGMGDEEGLCVYEVPEKGNESVVPLCRPLELEKTFGYQDMQCDDNRKESGGDDGGGGAWWTGDFRVMAIWMMLSAILMVNFFKNFLHHLK